MRLAILVLFAAFADRTPFRADFEDAKVGESPKGWTSALTGMGKTPVWKVIEDKTAPKGAKVLAQTSINPNASFNLCLVDGSSFKDLEIIVSYKAIKGKVDQGGGVVWRYIDPKNYYVARFNPLEDNFRLYKVVAGKRIQLGTKESLSAPKGEWHKIAVHMKGDTITCSLNGKKHLEAKDGTFTKAGKIGLWTKADAQTAFDDLIVEELLGEGK